MNSFINKFYNHYKSTILVKCLSRFFELVIFSNETLKLATNHDFYKIGATSSLLLSKEITNIGKIRSTGFARFAMPCTISRFACWNIIKSPRASMIAYIDDTEIIELLHEMSSFSKKTKIEILKLAFVKEFLRKSQVLCDELHYIKNIELFVLFGPIHGDFNRRNVLRYNNKLLLIDFDFFEHHNIHYFDFINLLVSDLIFEQKMNWCEAIESLDENWNKSVCYHCWNALSLQERRDILYLYFIWRCHNEVTCCGFTATDGFIENTLRRIRTLQNRA